jgi:hypothetical protein
MTETIAELEMKLAAARDRERDADEAKRKEQSEAWKVITANPDSWEWKVTPDEYKDWDAVKYIGAGVYRRVKPEIVAAWKQNGHAQFHYDSMDGNWHGMFYYRTDENILTNYGGGHCILKVPKLCSDPEWNELLSGKVISKFQNLY